VKRFLLVSSIAVYGGVAPPFAEDTRFPCKRRSMTIPTPWRLYRARCSRGLRCRHLRSPSNDPWSASPSITPLLADGGSATVHPKQKFNQHLLDVGVLRIPTQFGPGYREMAVPSACGSYGRGQGKSDAGAGYMGVPLSQLWSVIAVSRDLRPRHRRCARAHDSCRLPSASDIQPIQRLHHQCARTAADPLPDTRMRATSELRSGNASAEPYPSNGYNADLLTRDTGGVPNTHSTKHLTTI